jgi:hypothetical protein
MPDNNPAKPYRFGLGARKPAKTDNGGYTVPARPRDKNSSTARLVKRTGGRTEWPIPANDR